MYGMYFSFVLFCIAIYCNLLWWRDYYYHFFTYIHVLFSINVFKRNITYVTIANVFQQLGMDIMIWQIKCKISDAL